MSPCMMGNSASEGAVDEAPLPPLRELPLLRVLLCRGSRRALSPQNLDMEAFLPTEEQEQQEEEEEEEDAGSEGGRMPCAAAQLHMF